MRRRQFIATLGSAAVWPILARAQQLPVIGFLHGGAPEPNDERLAAFLTGLRETGFAEGQNVALEFRWAEGQNDRLPAMAADLVRRQVAAIATLSSTPAALAAKAATATIPIVFQFGADPVALGLVGSLNRPGGNATGISTLSGSLRQSDWECCVSWCRKPPFSGSFSTRPIPGRSRCRVTCRRRPRTLGVELRVLLASTDRDIDAAFANLALEPSRALLITTDPFFFVSRGQLATLAARYAVPTIYYDRQFANSGGLMSYGTSMLNMWNHAGVYTGRILKGERPADLPVVQSTKFELTINLKAAKAIGIAIPPSLLALADEVIE